MFYVTMTTRSLVDIFNVWPVSWFRFVANWQKWNQETGRKLNLEKPLRARLKEQFPSLTPQSALTKISLMNRYSL